MSQNQRIIGRYTRFESTNLPVDLYGNGQRQGDPYSPEHFVTTQVMAADTHTFNSSTVLDVRFGFLRWDYDRVPGNIGTNLTSTLGLPTVPYGQISERSGIPNMESIPTIGAGSNSFISTGLLYSVNNTYSVTPTLTKLAGDHTLKIGGNFMWATEDYFQNNSTGGTFNFANNPTALDGTNPGATGDPFASFLLGIPTGGTYQSSGWTYAATSYQAFFLDDSWQVSPKLTLNLGFRVERPGAFTEKDDRIVVFDRDAVNPVLAGRTNPVTGQPFLGAFELVNTNEQPDRGAQKTGVARRTARRHRVSAWREYGAARWCRHVHYAVNGQIPGRRQRARHPAHEHHRDERRQQPHVLHRYEQPVSNGRREFPRPR